MALGGMRLPPVNRVSSVTSASAAAGGRNDWASLTVLNSDSAMTRPCSGGSKTSTPSGGTLSRVLDSTAAGSDRSDRGSHDVGDLLHAVAFDVCEVDRGAEVARELLERTLEEGDGQLVQDFGIG